MSQKLIFLILSTLWALIGTVSIQAEEKIPSIELNELGDFNAFKHGTSTPRDFFVLTIPKCGSYLVLKLLRLLDLKDPASPYITYPEINYLTFPEDVMNSAELLNLEINFEKTMALWKFQKRFAFCHLNLSSLFHQYKLKHPEYIPIIQIRDLRDALVSCVYFQWTELECLLGPTSVEEKLKFLICLNDESFFKMVINIYRNAEQAVKWMNNPKTIICRFENLVGTKGGGTQQQQSLQIHQIAKAIGISLTSETLQFIQENLFGADKDTPTFREGKIGSWKTHFTPELIDLFNQRWGHLQLALGYSLD